MTAVRDLVAWLEWFAPVRLAEPWDNVGLLWGDPAEEVTRVMTCLTVTASTANEAIREGANLIVSHHPILFRAVKSIRSDRPESAMLWRLARSNVAIHSPHTAFDNTEGGINDGLARRLDLEDVASIRPSPSTAAEYKVVVFATRDDREGILNAAFEAGAGRIGAYEQCSFTLPGYGTFFGTEGTNPAVGRAGRREMVQEWRIELLCPADRLGDVLAAIRGRHSYETPALDVVPLHSPSAGPGVGRIGCLPTPMSLGEFAARVASVLNIDSAPFVGGADRQVGRVAIVCGAGDDFLGDAARGGADVLLTGEARFHRGLEAEAIGIGLVVAGHYATERPGVEDLAGRIGEAFPSATVWASRSERDPFAAKK